MTQTTGPAGVPADFEILTVLHGAVDAEARAYMEEKVRRVARLAPRPVLYARVKLGLAEDPALERPASVQATLDVSGRLVRAHVAAVHLDEGVDLLVERMERQLRDLADRDVTRRKRPAATGAGEWRHGDAPTHRSDFFPRPVEEREIVRHKSYGPSRLTPDDAAFDMRVQDYTFFLFTDAGSGVDALVFEDDDATVRLVSASGEVVAPEGATEGGLEWLVDTEPAPRLNLAEARERLDAGRERCVFFVNPETDRANVLYRRYDGHYGLISPADS